MNSEQIRERMKDVPGFLGVFPADQVPEVEGEDKSLIFNTNTSEAPPNQVGHWIALYYTKDTVEHFDTSATFPIVWPYIFKVNGREIVFADRKVQSPHSIQCGLFCIDFIKRRRSGETLQEILRSFARTRLFNDFILPL